MDKEEIKNKIFQGHVIDILKQFPDESVDLIVTSPPYFCYDEKTEILTGNGWKYFRDISNNEQIMSLNPQTYDLELQKIKERYEYDYNGKMIYVGSQNIDMLVTPNHKVFIKSINRNFDDKPYFKEAACLSCGNKIPVLGFVWKGIETDFFKLPYVENSWINSGKNIRIQKYEEKLIPIDIWLRFFGFWLADGWSKGSKGGISKNHKYVIGIKQKKFKEYVEKLFEDLKYNWRFDGKECGNFTIQNFQLWEYLKQFGNSHQKFIPQWIKDLPPEKLKIFLDNFLLGDGHLKKGVWYVYSVSDKMLNDIQEISLKLGYHSRISKRMIFIREKIRGRGKYTSIRNFKKEIDYKGKVYCVELEKYNVIIVRRNGIVYPCGNSLRSYSTKPQLWGGNKDCEHSFVEYKEVKSGGLGKETKGARFEKSGNICIKCGGFFGELGAEPTPQMFVNNLVSVFDEVKRVLKSTGSIYVNLNDTFSGSMMGYGAKHSSLTGFDKAPIDVDYKPGKDKPNPAADCGIPKKSLCCVPERFAIEMVSRGWILRNRITWLRENCKPESMKDRFTRQTEPIFFFTKSQNYYFRQILEPLAESTKKRCEGKYLSEKNEAYGIDNKFIRKYAEKVKCGEITGKNKRDVWNINVTHGYSEDGINHFAQFPMELPTTCIRASCPENGIVLDIFAGTGTTLVATRDLGRDYIGIDLSEKYCKLMARRLDLYQKKLEEF